MVNKKSANERILGKREALSEEQIERIHEEIRDPLTPIVIWLGFNHGLLASEICDLRLSDIDLDKGSIVVRTQRMTCKRRRILLNKEQDRSMDHNEVLRSAQRRE